jgi:hypothetical protein
MPLTGPLVAAYRRLRRVEPLDDADDWQADVEMGAGYFLLVVVGTIAGVAVIAIPDGAAFAVAYACLCGFFGFVVGTAAPLQLVAWRRLRRAALQGLGWRWVVPVTVAGVGFLVGLIAELA